MTKKIRTLKLTGTPYEMGHAHGTAFRDHIREYTEARIQLSMSEKWTGRSLSREHILSLAEACVPAHRAYAPDLMEELDGMAAATDLSLGEILIVNGYTDFIDLVYNHDNNPINVATEKVEDDCTAFIIPDHRSENGQGFYGQTWDMNIAATDHVILLDIQPDNGPNALAFTISGCQGMIGMNSEGIAVGINNLLASDGQIGVNWTMVIRKVLQQNNIEDALKCITDVKLMGAHNFLLFDKHGTGYNVEGMSTATHITKLEDEPIAHTNHCLMPNTIAVSRPRLPESAEWSALRLTTANQWFNGKPITAENLMELTRTEPVCTMRPEMDIMSCGAAIMRPATGDFWAVWGLPSENEYEHFTV